MVDPVTSPQVCVFARGPDVEDIDVVTTGGQLRGKMVVGDRPERGIEPEAVTEDHRKLTRFGMFRPIMTDTESPAVFGISESVGTWPQIRAGRITAHGGTSRHQT